MTKERKNTKKWIWWGVGVAAVVIIGVIVGVVIWHNNNAENGDGSNDGGTIEQGQTKAIDEWTEADGPIDEELLKKKVTQYEGEDPNESGELTGVVTYAGVVDDMVTIRVSIDQYVTDGVCDLALNRNGAIVYSGVARVMGEASTATCEGFDVPVSEIGNGSLEVVINVSADGKSGVIRGEAEI